MSSVPGLSTKGALMKRAATKLGTTLGGKYRLDAVLGIGGMASVYAATSSDGARVAIKLLHPELCTREDLVDRFFRERQAANAVKHPGVVDIHDQDVAGEDTAYLVMELLEGQTLEGLWEQNGQRLPPKSVLAIAYSLCDVLSAAHRASIVHRDLKPANLFLTHGGQLKVLDFGIASLHDSPRLTATGMLFGTPAFMAPEQARGEATLIDQQTDVWAVGAIMFSLLTGKAVHEGETGAQVICRAMTEPARSLATVATDAEPRLVALIDRALAFDKSARFRTAAELRAEISLVSKKLFGEAAPRIASHSETLVAAATPRLPPPKPVMMPPEEATQVFVATTTEPPAPMTAPMPPTLEDSPTRDQPLADHTRVHALVQPVQVPPQPHPRQPMLHVPTPIPAPPHAAMIRAVVARRPVVLGAVVVFGAALVLLIASSFGPATATAAAAEAMPITLVPVPVETAPPPPIPLPMPIAIAPSVPVPVPVVVRTARPAPAVVKQAPAAKAATRKVDCSQKYFVVDGKKVWRPECIE